ncbi:hypothetical protein OSG_eHP41_00010 [environmental Halophage eHP-41]|nr:hypothetical protein OSG_eHP41_00010 [environmental Halophage eHP-41]
MTVRIQSGQTVDIDRAIQDGFADIENAGTLTNAGTTIDIAQEKIALPAATSGTGSGLGSAVNPAEKALLHQVLEARQAQHSLLIQSSLDLGKRLMWIESLDRDLML